MTAYIVNILLLLAEGAALLWYMPSQQNKKTFCVFASVQWILLSGLRATSIGIDTYNYKVYFENISRNSWSSLLDDFVKILFNGTSGKDPGYPLFEKFISIFTTNFQVYLIIIALIFTIPLGIWIYKNSTEPLMSFLIYSSLYYAFFAITGLRQTIATALVVLIGYKCIKEKKFFPFLILVLVATSIHKSAICFLPFYFMADIKISKRYLMIMSTLIITISIFRSQVIAVIEKVLGYEEYVGAFKATGTWTFSAIMIVIFGLSIWKYKTMIENNKQVTHYFNALLIALVFVPLTYAEGTAMRVVQYYSVFIMLLVPEILRSFAKKEKAFVYYVTATLLIVLFIKTGPQYLFFWQQ